MSSMAEFSYASEAGTAGAFAELISLFLIVGSFILISYLNSKIRSRRTFQFEMLIFISVLALAEIPRTLYSLGIIDIDSLSDVGLELHSVSMLFLSLFVGYRIYGFAKGKPVTAVKGSYEHVILSSVDEALLGVFGENTSRAMNFYFDRTLALADPASYETALAHVFGNGSKLVTSAILDNVCKKAGVERARVNTLTEAWNETRAKVSGRT
ncbi:MAG: hypothetical protein HY296_03805 [Thaumarchaeota archaeon]|nr:hypothetical protein [Nitrososphaerota archaeon]